jgi:crotonobetainyl-CoA:carnitine CoA-transferase CaiB-like acyl-CoA transferase
MRPLEGMRVLALEQFGAAPYGTMFLADLGAEVVKIENPATGGDASRAVGPHMLGSGDSQYFQAFNLNKRSVALDIKTPEGREALLGLVAGAEAVVNNLRGDLPETLGIDYAGLKAANPAIVCLHISAYGRDNSRKTWPGYDFLMQAEAGLMSMTGEPDRAPSRIGLSMIDYMTGITGMVGLLSCVMQARQTRRGCDVDTSLFEVATHQLAYQGTWFLNTGEVPHRMARSAHASLVPVQTVRIGRSDLKADPRFANQVTRLKNRDELTVLLDEAMSARPTDEWLKMLTGTIPVAPIYDVDEAFANPFMTEADMVRTVVHPAKPELKVLANPLKIDGRRLEQKACAPLGADNAELLPKLQPKGARVAL